MHLLVASFALAASHAEVVTSLEKSRADLLDQWTVEDWKVAMLHGGFGIGGEAGEIVTALVTHDVPGLIKELGDAAFYTRLVLNGLAQGAELTGATYDTESIGFSVHSFDPIRDLTILQSELMDSIKKVVLYGQPLTDHANRIAQAARSYNLGLCLIGEMFGYSADMILAGNIKKLTGKEPLPPEKGRYENGYSDAAAKERADEASANLSTGRDAYAMVCEDLAALSPEERVDRLRPLTKNRPENHLFDVRSGLVIAAEDAFGADFAKIVIDAVHEAWSGEFPEGLDIETYVADGKAGPIAVIEGGVKDAGDDNDLDGETLGDRAPDVEVECAGDTCKACQ